MALGRYRECALGKWRVAYEGLQLPWYASALPSPYLHDRYQPFWVSRSDVTVPDSIWAVDNEGLEICWRYPA